MYLYICIYIYIYIYIYKCKIYTHIHIYNTCVFVCQDGGHKKNAALLLRCFHRDDIVRRLIRQMDAECLTCMAPNDSPH